MKRGGLGMLVLLGMLAARSSPAQCPAAEEPPLPGVQRLSAEEIRQAGAVRLSDLFGLLDGWPGTSVDLYTWAVSANALAAPQEESWLLLVDGQPVDLDALGVRNLNALPLDLAQVACVEAFGRPVLREGVFAPGGLLHLHTRPPGRGLFVEGALAAGNETGDPGPFRYTEWASPNVDRLGPSAHGAIGGGGSWTATAGLRWDQHYATDARMQRRVYGLYAGSRQPRVLLAAPMLQVRGGTGPGRHGLLAGYTHLLDLRFFEPLGREVPVRQELAYAGLDGGLAPGEGAAIRYRASYTGTTLGYRPNRRGLDFGWGRHRLRASAELRPRRGGAGNAVGVGVTYDRSRSAAGGLDPVRVHPYGYVQTELRLHRRWRQQAGLYAGAEDGGLRLGGVATGLLEAAPGHTVVLAVSFAGRQAEAGDGLWAWTARGYRYPQQSLEVDAGAFGGARTFTADLAWMLQPRPALTFTLSGLLRRFDGLLLPAYQFAYAPETDGFRTTVRLLPEAGGQVAGGSLRVRLRTGRAWAHRFQYTYLHVRTGDDAFRQAWGSVPRHQLGYSVRLVPSPRFGLYGRLQYRAATTWPAYAAADLGTDGRYPSRLPAQVLLEVTAHKRFWGDYLQASVSLRNLLNQSLRWHPAGAVSRLALFVRLELRIGP